MKTFSLLLIAMASFVAAGDVDTLYIPATVNYAEGLNVRGNIKSECNLENIVAQDIAHEAGRVYAKVVREKPKSGDYHVLDVVIADVFGAGGGAWSGPKYLSLRGSLKTKGGKVIGTFTARRHSSGGAFGAVKGTCGILKRCSRTLGKDVAQFLAAPTENNTLGD